MEFDSGWRQTDFPDKDHSPFFFLEMDRVPDEQLTREDFQHMFNIFESGNGSFTFTLKSLIIMDTFSLCSKKKTVKGKKQTNVLHKSNNRVSPCKVL